MSAPPKPPAIILGGLANAVSVARSLTHAGVPVYALGQGVWGEAIERSRHRRVYVRPEGPSVQAAWLAWLEANAHAVEGGVLLPCGDDGLELIANNRTRLAELGLRPLVAADDVVLTMLDKGKTYALARRLGIPAPKTVVLQSGEDIEAQLDGFDYPLALKPLHSHALARVPGAQKAFSVDDADEAARVLQTTAVHAVDMLATEIIPGPPSALFSYYSYIDEGGKPLFHATKQKLRQFPVDFGVASYNVTRWDRSVAEMGSRFFLEAGVRGFAEVEFKRDPRDETPKLIECNHRFTGANELLRLAGLDFALLVYNRAVGYPDPPLDTYRDGVYLWGPILDTHAFLSMRRRRELSAQQWLRSLRHLQHFPVFSVDDPVPTVVDLARRTKLFVRESGSRRAFFHG